LGRFYTDFSVKNAAVAALAFDALVKGEVVDATPKSAGCGVIA
jgi:hypothetical protein